MQCISKKNKKSAGASRKANGNLSRQSDGRQTSSISRKLRGQSNQPSNGRVEKNESLEKSKSAKNIVERGLPENNEKEDQDLAKEMFKNIECHQIEITCTMRLGRKEEEPKMKPLRVTLKNQEKKIHTEKICKSETGQNRIVQSKNSLKIRADRIVNIPPNQTY